VYTDREAKPSEQERPSITAFRFGVIMKVINMKCIPGAFAVVFEDNVDEI
jgi:hypothetical protein